MAYEDLKKRMKKSALDLIKLVEMLPNDRAGKILGGQLLRSGTSVGANYRSACRARSTADFISKMGIVEEEADETVYWLELLVGAGKLNEASAAPFIREANELTAIAVSSINTTRKSGGRNQDSAFRIPHSAFE
jgi:four helix bundle protein